MESETDILPTRLAGYCFNLIIDINGLIFEFGILYLKGTNTREKRKI